MTSHIHPLIFDLSTGTAHPVVAAHPRLMRRTPVSFTTGDTYALSDALPFPYKKVQSSLLNAMSQIRSKRKARNLDRVIGYLLANGYIHELTQAPNEHARLRYTGRTIGGRPGYCILYRNGTTYPEGEQCYGYLAIIAQIGGSR